MVYVLHRLVVCIDPFWSGTGNNFRFARLVGLMCFLGEYFPSKLLILGKYHRTICCHEKRDNATKKGSYGSASVTGTVLWGASDGV